MENSDPNKVTDNGQVQVTLAQLLARAETELRSAAILHAEIPNELAPPVPHISRAWYSLFLLWGTEQQIDLMGAQTIETIAPVDLSEPPPATLNEARQLALAHSLAFCALPQNLPGIPNHLELLHLAINNCRRRLRAKGVLGSSTNRLTPYVWATVALLLIGLSSFVYVHDPYPIFQVVRFKQAWGTLRSDQSVIGGPLSVGSKIYKNGFGTHADSMIVLKIKVPVTRIRGACGIDDEVGNAGSIVCRILNGHELLYTSGTLSGADPAAQFDVELSQVKELTLEIISADEDISADHADWVDLAFVLGGTTTSTSGQ